MGTAQVVFEADCEVDYDIIGNDQNRPEVTSPEVANIGRPTIGCF
jgi:hypothetical protein